MDVTMDQSVQNKGYYGLSVVLMGVLLAVVAYHLDNNSNNKKKDGSSSLLQGGQLLEKANATKTWWCARALIGVGAFLVLLNVPAAIDSFLLNRVAGFAAGLSF